jgi:uridine kinase
VSRPDLGRTLDPVVARVRAARPTIGAVRLVVVDGPAGSGKTTVAAALAAALDDAPVVHADELYEGWTVVEGCADRTDAFGSLAERVSGWLLDAWEQGRPGEHPVWDWTRDRWATSPRSVPAASVVVLEGVGMAAASLRNRAVAAIWVEHPDPAERLRRVLARDGAALEEQMRRWQDEESRWFAHDGTRAGCTEALLT